MSVDFQALRDLDLTGLRNRLTAWTAVASSMSDSVSLFTSGVEGGMGDDRWTGAAAEQAGVRSGELRRLVAAGATEATAIRDILAEAVDRLGEAKTELDQLVAEVDAIPEIRVTAAGTVELSPDIDANDPARVVWSHHACGLQERLDAVVDRARSADAGVAEALGRAAETGDATGNTFNTRARAMPDAPRPPPGAPKDM